MHESTNAPMNVTEPLNVDSNTAVSTHGYWHIPMYTCPLYTFINAFHKSPVSPRNQTQKTNIDYAAFIIRTNSQQ